MSPPSFGPSELEVPDHVRQEWQCFSLQRDRIRSEIRARMKWRLFKLTGRQHACMHWTRDSYLSEVIKKYNCTVYGWPDSIPFRNLSEIRGGTRSLQQLLDLWMRGKLRIVKLDAAERADALHNPDSRFLPKSIRSARTDQHTLPRVIPLVLHPVDMHDISRPAGKKRDRTVSMTTSSLAAAHLHKTRSDTKRPRSNIPRRRKRRGLCTPEYVHEPADTESEREEGSSLGLKRLRVAYSEEHVEELPADEPEDDIESASESWQLGGGSDRGLETDEGHDILDSDPIEMFDE